jgi:hypothetical protein
MMISKLARPIEAASGRWRLVHLPDEEHEADPLRRRLRGRWAAQELAEEVPGRAPLLPARPPHRHQHGLGPCAGQGPAPAPDFAQDDPEADRQFGPPVGGVQPRHTQEREQVVAVRPQVLDQPLVDRVRLGREDQAGQPVLQASAGHGLAVAADLPRCVAVTQVQAGPEQFGDPPRETYGATGSSGFHLVATPEEVLHTLPVPGVLELVVRRPAVADHGAAVGEAQDGLGHGAAAGRVDDVGGGPRPDQGVQPGGYPPTLQPVSSGTTQSDWPSDWRMLS